VRVAACCAGVLAHRGSSRCCRSPVCARWRRR